MTKLEEDDFVSENEKKEKADIGGGAGDGVDCRAGTWRCLSSLLEGVVRGLGGDPTRLLAALPRLLRSALLCTAQHSICEADIPIKTL